MFNKKYSYDDLLLIPQYSEVESRDDVSLSTRVTPSVKIDSPLISAPMDTVTGPEMLVEMDKNGGVGVLHRFEDRFVRADWIDDLDVVCGASVGISDEDIDIAVDLEKAGANFICVDVAHGHMQKTVEFVERLREEITLDIMVGNVVTYRAVKDLVRAGADSVKVGVGSGSVCTTRVKTGHGYPQASAVVECSSVVGLDRYYTIIADGGIRNPGDVVKALMLGADAVMMGGIFGRTFESPQGGDVWGMASVNGNEEKYIEGEISESEEKYSVSDVFREFEEGIRSGISYSGGYNIDQARKRGEVIEVTDTTVDRNGSFIE